MKVLRLVIKACFVLLFAVSSFGAEAQRSPASVAVIRTSAVPRATLKKRIVFFGNSLTAGYGVAAQRNLPSLIAQKIDSAGLSYTVVNAGVSGETTAGGLRRIGSVLRQPVDVFVLELGANDAFRMVPVADIRRNLQGIVDAVKRRNPKAQIVIAGMQIPGVFGPGYVSEFQGVFRDVAAKNRARLIPFLLENVGGIRELNQPDGIHPTAAGYRIVAGTVWKTLGPLLQPADAKGIQ